jgi:DNA-binding transcriptional ArsR family regulator
MVVDTADDLDRLLYALSDKTRREIYRLTISSEQSVSDLARRFPMSFAAVQKHVAVLERARLIEKRTRGRERLVSSRAEALREVEGLLDEFESRWRERLAGFEAVLDSLKERDGHAGH